ncbi:hypothetical protein, partial [Escherichia coli]|uniref:hypothetical protein n=1 Tax=Escherichia coli TaxID=562 RepID=UPI001BDB6F0B
AGSEYITDPPVIKFDAGRSIPAEVCMLHLLRLAPPLLLAALLSARVSGCSREAAAPEPVRAVRTQLVSTSTASSSHEYAAEVKPR